MEYLVTMTTHVPDGTPDQAVDDVRTREAARSRELAAAGHLHAVGVQLSDAGSMPADKTKVLHRHGPPARAG